MKLLELPRGMTTGSPAGFGRRNGSMWHGCRQQSDQPAISRRHRANSVSSPLAGGRSLLQEASTPAFAGVATLCNSPPHRGVGQQVASDCFGAGELTRTRKLVGNDEWAPLLLSALFAPAGGDDEQSRLDLELSKRVLLSLLPPPRREGNTCQARIVPAPPSTCPPRRSRRPLRLPEAGAIEQLEPPTCPTAPAANGVRHAGGAATRPQRRRRRSGTWY